MSQTKVDVDAPVGHKVYELSTTDEERLEELFNKLDADGKGRIDINDLSRGLKTLNVPHHPSQMAQIKVSECFDYFNIR